MAIDVNQVLQLLRKENEHPQLTDERGFHYIFAQLEPHKWEVCKLAEDGQCTIYTLGRFKSRWICNCPAGRMGRQCKHKDWVAFLSAHQNKHE